MFKPIKLFFLEQQTLHTQKKWKVFKDFIVKLIKLISFEIIDPSYPGKVKSLQKCNNQSNKVEFMCTIDPSYPEKVEILQKYDSQSNKVDFF